MMSNEAFLFARSHNRRRPVKDMGRPDAIFNTQANEKSFLELNEEWIIQSQGWDRGRYREKGLARQRKTKRQTLGLFAVDHIS